MNMFNDRAIANLDLEPVKRRLTCGRPGAAWSGERADAAESEYRRFLFLMKRYPNELAAPSVDVDRFWHQHIVDTAKYALDCEAVFGYFLHRYPYLGIGSEHDDAARLQAGERMRELYSEVFGTPHDDASAGTSFAFAVRLGSRTESSATEPDWTGPDEAEEAEDADDLLDQVRFVVIENQRYDRVAEPVM